MKVVLMMTILIIGIVATVSANRYGYNTYGSSSSSTGGAGTNYYNTKSNSYNGSPSTAYSSQSSYKKPNSSRGNYNYHSASASKPVYTAYSGTSNKPSATYSSAAKKQQQHDDDYLATPHYKADWAVVDDYSYVNMGQTEVRHGDKTTGSYSVVLPDGRRQNVNYSDDGYSGLIADVTYDDAYTRPIKNNYGRGPSRSLGYNKVNSKPSSTVRYY